VKTRIVGLILACGFLMVPFVCDDRPMAPQLQKEYR